jgi:DNA polymerase-3 subunit delta'
MFFKEVIGQKAIQQKLLQAVKDQRVSHAQLFAGNEGCGNLALALAYAQYISCSDKQEEDSCGQCPSCKKYEKLIHPDLHFVFPVAKTPKVREPVSDHFLTSWRAIVQEHKAYFSLEQWFAKIGVENVQGMIYAHESTEIIKKLSQKSFESEFKVMIIWAPEKMNTVCANKLLKIIEEPPGKMLFILVSENEEALIGTIRSRCQFIKIPAIQEKDMIKAIATLPGAGDQPLRHIARLSNGNFVKAKNMFNVEPINRLNFKAFVSLMRLVWQRKFLDITSWINELVAIGRERQKSFLEYAMNLIRENFIMRLQQPDLNYLNEDEKAFSVKFSSFINEQNILAFFTELEKAHRDIAMNGNPRIVFFDLSLKLMKLIRK